LTGNVALVTVFKRTDIGAAVVGTPIAVVTLLGGGQYSVATYGYGYTGVSGYWAEESRFYVATVCRATVPARLVGVITVLEPRESAIAAVATRFWTRWIVGRVGQANSKHA
jgi:hypothetical protein